MSSVSEENSSRPASQASSTRRRWDTVTKESFEGCLAVETPSPVAKNKNNTYRKLSAAGKKSTSDPYMSYKSSKNESEKPVRAKSAVKKGNRETEAELKHSQKMAEGRRVRGSSANSDKQLLKEVNAVNYSNTTRIPSAVSNRSLAKKSKDKNESANDKDYANNSKLNSDNSPSESLSIKHSMILNNLNNSTFNKKSKSNNTSQDSVGTDETLSKEEGYGSDDSKAKKNIKRKPSAPPIDYSDNTSSDNASYPQNANELARDSVAAPNTVKSRYRSASRETTPSRRKKSSKKKHSSSEISSDTFIKDQLRKLEDDVIDFSYLDDKQFSGNTGPPDFIVTNPNGESNSIIENQESLSTVSSKDLTDYVLSKDGKKYIKRKRITFDCEEERILRTRVPPSRATMALFLQTSFRTFAVCCQGLLAGLSIAHCLMIFLMADSWSQVADVLPPRLTNVFYTLTMLLTFVVFVASCDRCDLCSSDGGLLTRHSLHIPWSAGLYFMSLCLTVATSRTEVLLAYRHTPLPNPHQTGGIGWYAWVSLAKTVTNTLAWLAVVPDPHTDNLLNKLHLVVRRESQAKQTRTGN